MTGRSAGEPSGMKASEMPRFFKVIFGDTLTTNTLLIPSKFAILHGKTLSDTITLELPCGSKWKVGLERQNGDMTLHAGLQEMFKHYSVKLGHMLFFAFEGNSKFRVSMFDRTACEIDYSVIAHEESLSRKGKSPQVKPQKKRKAKPLGNSEKREFHFMTRGFSCLRKPHFKVVMRKTYVHGSRMAVPVNFAQQHLQENCHVILNGSDGQSWKMEYSNGVYNERQLYASPKLHSGWKNFAVENELGVGDFCMFVLSKDCGQVSFDVTIFRAEHCQ